MESIILALHIVVCVLLVILILLQSGKEGMGVIFGGGNTSVFGSSGAGSLLAKMTAFMAVIFVLTSLSYTYVIPLSSTFVSRIRLPQPRQPRRLLLLLLPLPLPRLRLNRPLPASSQPPFSFRLYEAAASPCGFFFGVLT